MRTRAFDFTAKTERELIAGEVAQARAQGAYVWIDLDASADRDAARPMLLGFGLDGPAADAALDPDADGAPPRPSADAIRLTVAAPGPRGDRVELIAVSLLLGEGFCATVRRGGVAFIDDVWSTCPADFRNFARSPGFLIYEFWDHLIAAYRDAAGSLSDRVRRAQDEAFDATGDEIFGRVAALSGELLTLRRAMVAAREALTVIATRRSALVPKSTRPYLRALVGTLDRLVADLAVEREILAETLNLYIGLVGHRTNQVVNRLTVVSFVFLPLTFLCGVYGMNFDVLPELHWTYGYAGFWAVSLATVWALLRSMKRRKWF